MNGWTLGADGSHWAGDINFVTMYERDAKFYIGKASDSYRGGGLFEDKRFKEHFDAAFSFGQLLLGGFHWLQPDVDPTVAADFYLERYFRYPFHFPPILDFEEPYVYKNNLQGHYSWCAEVWLDRVEAQTGRKPIIYTAKWYTNYFADKYISWMGKYPLWVAQYPWLMTSLSRPSLPGVWDNWRIWQFSADENKRGAEFGVQARDIDLNYYQGSYADLLTWLDTGEPEPVEPTEPEGTMYEIYMLGNLTIRSQPFMADGNETGKYALKGQTYFATEEKNGWYHIEGGWISGLTQWTRITKIEQPAPEPPVEPPALTLEERVTDNTRRIEILEAKCK